MIKNYLSEFLGSFLIVLFGCGSIIINEQYNGLITHLGISVTFGGIVCICIYLFKKHSTHFNPAVSVTLCANNQLSLKHLLFYMTYQCLGAMFAAFILHILFPLNSSLGSTTPTGNEWQSFLLEFILTLLLLALVFVFDKWPTKYAGVLIGCLIFLEAYFGGPISGASMNPARSIGPALISGKIEKLWIYIIAPILGGLTAFVCFNFSKFQK